MRSIAQGLVVVLAGLVMATPVAGQFGKNKVQYREFDWRVYTSPHFQVHYYPEEEALLPKVVSLAESAYDELSRELDFQIQETTPLIFYKTHSEFEQNNVITGFIPEGVGAFATPVRYRMVLPADLPDRELYALIKHELTHIFQYHILFSGKISRSLATRPPLWLMEGMASYFGEDESTSDKMFLRDAVVNDIIPPITRANVSGFFAYRFGHAAFDYLEERWGSDGVRDFLYEFRNSFGSGVEKALDQAFRIEPEDFDADFRRWLRKSYLPELVSTGEPSDFGRRFYAEDASGSQHISGAISPSGDLVAAFGTPDDEVDIVLFDTRKRRMIRNLTKGFQTEYQYFSVQYFTSGRRLGSDLAFSPDGNRVVAFAKREGGRSLVFVDVLKGGIDEIIDIEVEQPSSPAWSPDGRKIAFAGSQGAQFDIFLLDLTTRQVSNLTNDERYDGGPAWSPDGASVVFSSEVATHDNLFRVDLANPGERIQLTSGEANDVDASFDPDGSRLFFTSDRNGYENIHALDLASGQVVRHTNAVTGCFMPEVLERAEGGKEVVYSGYWRGRFDLYRFELDDPLEKPAEVVPARGGDETPAGSGQTSADSSAVGSEPPLGAGETSAPGAPATFEPPIVVTIDEEAAKDYSPWKLKLEDASVNVGVTDDSLLVSQSIITFSDLLGDRRFYAQFSSVASFSDFNVGLFDLSHRWQWGVQLFDDRAFYLEYVQRSLDELDVDRTRLAFRQTGLAGSLTYPFSFHRRVELSAGFILRKYDFQSFFQDPQTGEITPTVLPREDEYPFVSAAFVTDTTLSDEWGPLTGRRWRISGYYAPDLDDSGVLTSSVSLDVRQYFSLTRRSSIALRLFAGASDGNAPNVFYFGGGDDFRASRYRAFAGDRAFYSNVEFRFPLAGNIALFGALPINGIRGRVFLDIAGSWFDYAGQDFEFWNSDESRLEDAFAAYGWGMSVRFAGLDLHWDFSKAWDGESTLGDGFRTNFWIGRRF